MAERSDEGLLASLKGNPATDRLKEEATAFASAQVQRLLMLGGQKLGAATARLQDVADGDSAGTASLALKGGRKLAEGKGPVRAALETGGGHLKDALTDKVKEAFGAGGSRKGGGGKGRFVTIVEDIDVGVPVREAYDQWTQFQEFSTFAKGVQGVESTDDTSSNWRAKVFWSTRSWKADTTEQIPDQRIAWTSEGAKGTTKGVVTFHPLGENLTKVLLVIEYHPKGLFEKTGNIWRAQGRRARLDLKHFRRFLTMRGEATGAWRGEIRDGEVVLSHEDAVAREEEDRPEDSEGRSRDDANERDEKNEQGEQGEQGVEGEEFDGDEEFGGEPEDRDDRPEDFDDDSDDDSEEDPPEDDDHGDHADLDAVEEEDDDEAEDAGEYEARDADAESDEAPEDVDEPEDDYDEEPEPARR